MTGILKGYTAGTHRLVSPERTLERVTPHLAACGITRCADVTGLDRLGIPVYCAIRPSGRVVQVYNGKGLRHVDAKVSALMEAIEVFHREAGTAAVRASFNAMHQAARDAIPPELFPGFRLNGYYDPNYVIGWIEAEDLLAGRQVWVPASLVYPSTPALYDWSTNGLASGNHRVEATLHGLYEVIERDTISRLTSNGRLDLGARCRFVDLATTEGPVAALCEAVWRADLKLVLIAVEGAVPVATFWAVLLDGNPLSWSSRVRVGYGSHLSAQVAATRAITEAAQSRLTFIHGAREDLSGKGSYGQGDPSERLYDYFDRIQGTTPWAAFRDDAGDDLEKDYGRLLGQLQAAGYRHIYRVDLTRSPFDIPVITVFVCGMTCNLRLF